MHISYGIFSLLTFGCMVFALPIENLDQCAILEMTYEFGNNTIYWPNADPFRLEVVAKGKTKEGFFYEAHKFCAAEHGGTHMDAPVHFNENGFGVDKVPLQTFVGEACVVDVTAEVKKNRDYAVTQQDLQNWETQHGPIDERCIVVIHTGYGVHWPNKKMYLGTDVHNDVENLHFPGVSKEAATWLVSNRNFKALGIDTASMDPGPSKDFFTHQIIHGKNMSGFENLRNVDKLPARGATIFAIPTMIKEGTGAPLRAFAVGWNGPQDPCRRKNSADIFKRMSLLQIIIFAFLILCIF